MDIIGLPRKVASVADDVYSFGEDVLSPLIQFSRERPNTATVAAITATLVTAALRRNFLTYSDDAAFVSESVTAGTSQVRLATDLPKVPGELSGGGKVEPSRKTFEEVMGTGNAHSRMESLMRTAAAERITGGKNDAVASGSRDQEALSRLGFPRLNIFS